jgi:FxsC-like protein
MSNWFFLSYATHDQKTDTANHIKTFYEDLDRDIRGFKTIKEGRAGFFAGTEIEPGEKWPAVLGEALRSARVLICLYSPAYFNSSYCGKEWTIFESRLASDFPEGGARPALILPVLFGTPEDVKSRPAVAKDIQYGNEKYPPEYLENGLKYLMMRSSKREAYLDFKDAFLKRFKAAISTHNLSPLRVLPDIKTVADAFHSQAAELSGGNPLEESTENSQNGGPQFAEFVYVAARRDEILKLKPVGPNHEYYGSISPQWIPYLPPDEAKEARQVVFFAQAAANNEGFIIYQQGPAQSNLIERLEEAQKNNRTVVLIVDTWTLELPQYQAIMQKYDAVNFRNCAVLIIWNKDSSANRDILQRAIQRALYVKSGIKDERYYIDSIRSEADLIKFLSVALQKVKMQIVEYGEVFRKIDSQEIINKPEIPMAGGA